MSTTTNVSLYSSMFDEFSPKMIEPVDVTYDWAIESIRKNLLIFGLWKNPTNTRQKIIMAMPIFIIEVYIIICSIIPQTWALYVVRKHLTLVAASVMLLTSHYFGLIKITFLLWKRKVITKLFTIIEQDWNIAMDVSEKAMMIQYWLMIRKIHVYAVVMSLVAVLSFHGSLLFNFVIRPVTNLTDKVPGRPLVHTTIYPFDTQPSPTFELMAINECIQAITVCLCIIVADVLYSLFVFHTCGQLQILANRISNITKHPNEQFNHLLKLYVRHHIRIIKFSRDVDDLFNMFILLLFIHFTLTFCCQAFMISTVKQYSTSTKDVFFKDLFSISFTSYMLFLMFLYCWAGEDLISKSEDIYHAAYNCDWTKLPPNMAISLNLIISRSQIPLAVTAGKFLVINLNTYAKLLKTCGGYVSVMAAVEQ